VSLAHLEELEKNGLVSDVEVHFRIGKTSVNVNNPSKNLLLALNLAYRYSPSRVWVGDWLVLEFEERVRIQILNYAYRPICVDEIVAISRELKGASIEINALEFDKAVEDFLKDIVNYAKTHSGREQIQYVNIGHPKYDEFDISTNICNITLKRCRQPKLLPNVEGELDCSVISPSIFEGLEFTHMMFTDDGVSIRDGQKYLIISPITAINREGLEKFKKLKMKRVKIIVVDSVVPLDKIMDYVSKMKYRGDIYIYAREDKLYVMNMKTLGEKLIKVVKVKGQDSSH